MADVTLGATLQRIAQAPTRRALWSVLLDAFHARDVVRGSFHPTSADHSTMEVFADGFPTEWVKEYVSKNFVKVDPVPELASRLSEPVYWHDAESLVEHTPEIDTYLQFARKAGLGDGLALTVFGPGLQNAYVSLGYDSDRIDLSSAEIFELHTIAQAGYLRYCALQEGKKPIDSLTRREIEVLRWVARGKSNSVIADILNISVHTVDAHMRKIYAKLNVTDRTSAAIAGLGAGLLQRPDHVTTGSN